MGSDSFGACPTVDGCPKLLIGRGVEVEFVGFWVGAEQSGGYEYWGGSFRGALAPEDATGDGRPVLKFESELHDGL